MPSSAVPSDRETESRPALETEPTVAERVALLVQTIQDEADALRRLSTALAPFGKADAYGDWSNLSKGAERLAARLEEAHDAPAAARARALTALELVRSAVEDEKRRMRENLAPELRAACEARGLGLRVLKREDPVELRIPPLGVVIDRDKGRAELRFARTPLLTAPAEALAIVEAHARAMALLDTPDFDPEAFFRTCHRAWIAARAAGGGGERVEILDFLPYLAVQLQPQAFQIDPTERNYKGYSRVRFAWDVLRLRRAGGFVREGLRFNLGVATGTTATQKKRVIWFEDEQGDGEYKLTVFFTHAEGA